MNAIQARTNLERRRARNLAPNSRPVTAASFSRVLSQQTARGLSLSRALNAVQEKLQPDLTSRTGHEVTEGVIGSFTPSVSITVIPGKTFGRSPDASPAGLFPRGRTALYRGVSDSRRKSTTSAGRWKWARVFGCRLVHRPDSQDLSPWSSSAQDRPSLARTSSGE